MHPRFTAWIIFGCCDDVVFVENILAVRIQHSHRCNCRSCNETNKTTEHNSSISLNVLMYLFCSFFFFFLNPPAHLSHNIHKCTHYCYAICCARWRLNRISACFYLLWIYIFLDLFSLPLSLLFLFFFRLNVWIINQMHTIPFRSVVTDSSIASTFATLFCNLSWYFA